MRSARFAAVVAFASSVAASSPTFADGEKPDGIARVTAHAITVRFDPKRHRLVGEDVLSVDTASGTTVRLGIHPVRETGMWVTVDGAEAGADREGGLGVSVVTLPKAATRLRVAYEGEIFDAVQKKDDLSWVVGDATRGVISEKGIYLNGGSGWYPQVEGDALARFDVTALVPEPFLVVTQGGVPERSTETIDGVKYAKCVSHAVIPTDGCELVAGPYKVSTESYEGLELSTYFLEGEAGDAPLWMAAMKDVVRRYESVLGTYPHPKFDVVENFFATGYGMPSFTLLGDTVIQYVTAGAKGSGGRIPPGYLDHEYVHGWFGNGLFVDPNDGNWCEALTTYFSNYYAKELESPDAARDHRRGVLEHYAIRVKPENDYPVREFRTKTEDKDNDIGYGKGSMIFHMLRKRLGDERFFAAVKSMCEKRVGTYVSWKDWLAALDGEWVRPWLERKGLPAIRLASATAWPASPFPRTVRCEAVIDAPHGAEPWPAIDVPVFLDGKRLGGLRLEGGRGTWRGDPKGGPANTLELDADYDVLRRVADDDLPACLNRTLETPGAAVERIGAERTFGPLAERLGKEKGLEVLPPSDHEKGGRPNVVLLVKRPGETLMFGDPRGGGLVVDSATGVRVGGQSFRGPDVSVLVSMGGKWPTTSFIAMSEDAAARARYITYYGWDQYVVFEAGRRTPLARGFLDRDPKATRRPVLHADGAADRVDDDVRKIATDEYGVRRPGRIGPGDVRDPPRTRFRPPQGSWTAEPFPLRVDDLVSPRDLVLVTESGREVLKDAFRPLFDSPSREAGTPLPFAEGPGAVPLPGRIPDTSPDGLARFARQVQDGTAPAILLAPSADARKALAPLLDAPNALTPDSAAEYAKPGRGGLPRRANQIAPAIAARRTRAWPSAPAELRVPVLVLEESAIARLEAKPTVTAVDFSVEFGPPPDAPRERGRAENLFATAVPPPAGERPAAILVSAHYDTWGRDGDVVFQGADDNGSGVACLLEAMRGLEAEMGTATAKAGVVFALFDGEEWGLQGSRAAVASLSRRYDVKAVVNVDAVGRVRDDTVYVLGLSAHPDLAAKAKDALATEGLKVGRDIDGFGYAEGSDHWPFHQAGIPAITLWASDYATMDTPGDTPDKVDPVGVARIAKALRRLIVRLATE